MTLPIVNEDIVYTYPDRIRYAIMPATQQWSNTEPLKNGNWDLSKKRLEEIDTFCALREYFTHGVPLAEAGYYTSSLEPGELKEKEIDALYCRIRDTGYKTQKELGNTSLSGEIKVSIDRNGSFLLEDGKVRLAIVKALGIERIPVVVTRRHYRWARFKEDVFLYSQEQPKGAYQPMIHPDLQKIPAHRKEDRWELIVDNLPLPSGTVLDIGANWGYFCHKFEDLGFDCFAVERNYRWLYFLRKLRDIENKRFEIIPQSVFDLKRKKYDIVLALSIFHHFLRSKALYNKLTKLLGELDMKIMFFEPHETGHGFPGAYIDYSETEFIGYIIENSCLSKHKLLGRTERGRNLYLLSSL
jgi:hypothetical protein